MRQTYLLPLGFVVLVAVGYGCSDDPDIDESSTPGVRATVDRGQACTNDATATAVTEESRARFAIPAETRAAKMDQRRFVFADDEIRCRLRTAALRLDELPDGWVMSDMFGVRDPVIDPSATAACGLPFPSAVAGISESYTSGDNARDGFITHRVVALEPAGGELLMEAIRRSCESEASDNQDALHYRNLRPISGLGDEAIAVEGYFADPAENQPTTALQYTVFRKNDIVSVLSVFSPDASMRSEEIAKDIAGRLGNIPALPEATPVSGCGCGVEVTEIPGRESELGSGLLTIDDLERGWVEDPPEPCGRIFGDSVFCPPSEASLPEPESWAMTTFKRSAPQTSVGLSHRVERYKGDDAEELMDAMEERNTSEVCEGEIDGRSLKWTFEPIPLEIGEQSQAWVAHTTVASSQDVVIFVALVRRGDSIASVVYTPRVSLRRVADRGLEFEELQLHEYVQLADASLQRLEN